MCLSGVLCECMCAVGACVWCFVSECIYMSIYMNVYVCVYSCEYGNMCVCIMLVCVYVTCLCG